MVGSAVGRWTVLRETEKNGKRYYECRCECGTVKDVYYLSLECGRSLSCGCLRSEMQRAKGVDLTGKKIGRLTVLSRDPDRQDYWICECECGNRKSIVTKSLREGNTHSCGCIQSEVARGIGTRTVAKNAEKQIKMNLAYHTNFQVIANENLPKNNRSGHKGVWWDKSRSMWQAYIQVHGKKISLGRHYDIKDAIRAREAAEEEYFAPLLEARGAGGQDEGMEGSRPEEAPSEGY